MAGRNLPTSSVSHRFHVTTQTQARMEFLVTRLVLDTKIDKENFLLNIFHIRDQRSRFAKVRNKVSRSIAFGTELFSALAFCLRRANRQWGFGKFISLVVHKICIHFYFSTLAPVIAIEYWLAVAISAPKILSTMNAGLRV